MDSVRLIIDEIKTYNGCFTGSWYLEGTAEGMEFFCSSVQNALAKKNYKASSFSCVRMLRWPVNGKLVQLGDSHRHNARCYLLSLEIGIKFTPLHGKSKQ